MNEYLNVIKAFTVIAFFNANNPCLLQNLGKQVSEQKKIQSTHIPLTVWRHLGIHLMVKCVRAAGHPWVGLSSAELAVTGRRENSLGLVGFIVERTLVLSSIVE